MNINFTNNLKSFLKENSITQTQFAKTLGVSNASISNYISGQSEPTLSFLLKLKSSYNVSLDEFLTKQTSHKHEQTLEEQNLSRFVGNYILYFYDSSSYIGRASNKQKNVLKFGVISIVEKGNNLFSYGCFLKNFDKAKTLKEELDSSKNNYSIKESFSNFSDFVYEGEIETSTTQIFIMLKSFNDQSLIVLNNPPSNKMYIGGLGTVNSVSRGREHMPCVQFLLLSRKVLDLPEGEIYNLLSLDVADINVHNETEKLISLFKNLYMNTGEGGLRLEEYQKKKIFEDSLENIVQDLIESNIFRFAKISAKEDDHYYNLIKGED